MHRSRSAGVWPSLSRARTGRLGSVEEAPFCGRPIHRPRRASRSRSHYLSDTAPREPPPASRVPTPTRSRSLLGAMPRQFRPRKDLNLDRMFETRSDAWEKAGLSFEVNQKEVKRAQRQAIVWLVLLIAVDVATHILLSNTRACPDRAAHNSSLLGNWGLYSLATPLKILSAILVLAFGWGLARSIRRFVGPTFLRRMGPAPPGTVGFLIRLITVGIALIIALNVGGASFQSLAVGGAFTAVILGLAAQQTLGNVIAGMVLLTARPFRVGQRVRLQAGALSGQIDR